FRKILVTARCRGSSPVERGPEKAGVGSSTLPLGTTLPAAKQAVCRTGNRDVPCMYHAYGIPSSFEGLPRRKHFGKREVPLSGRGGWRSRRQGVARSEER